MRRAMVMMTGILVLLGCGSGTTSVSVYFPGAGGLEEGDPVRMDEIRIGSVARIAEEEGRVRVDLAIDPEFTSYLTQGSEARLVREGIFSRSRFVRWTPGTGDALADGAFLVGTEEAWTERVKRWTDEARSRINSPETRDKLREFTDSVEEAAREGKEEWERRRPELEARARELIEQAQAEGVEAAEWMRRQLERMLEENEDPPGDFGI